MAMKRHKPDFFSVIKTRAKCLEISDHQGFDSVTQLFLRLMRDDPVMSPHYTRLEVAMTQQTAVTWTAVPPEPWSTIVHADFWVNNIMFRSDGTGRVADVKFVDFQNYLFLSPLRELTFFMMINFKEEVMAEHFDELLDEYYGHFIAVLKRMDCDVEPFSRDKFDERLRIDAFEEFPHCPFMMKVMTTEAGSDANPEDLMMEGTFNPILVERLRRCVKKFAEKGWL